MLQKNLTFYPNSLFVLGGSRLTEGCVSLFVTPKSWPELWPVGTFPPALPAPVLSPFPWLAAATWAKNISPNKPSECGTSTLETSTDHQRRRSHPDASHRRPRRGRPTGPQITQVLSSTSTNFTVPARPSIRTTSPVFTAAINPSMPTIVGMPISRATIAEWDNTLPRSIKTPDTDG